MRLAALFLFVLATAGFANGQSPAENGQARTIPFIAYWSKGDVYEFEVTKISIRWQDGELMKNDSTSYTARFEVLDSAADHYRLRWRFDNHSMNQELSMISAVEHLKRKLRIPSLTYRTTEMGEFVEFEDVKEVTTVTNTLLKELEELDLPNQSADYALVKQLSQTLKDPYQAKGFFELVVFPEIQIVHHLMGIEFPANEVVNFEEEVPNMLGSGTATSQVKMYADSVDFDNGYCVLIKESSLDPEGVKSIMRELFKNTDLSDPYMQQVLSSAKLEVNENTRLAHFFYPGIPERLETSRETRMEIGPESIRSLEIIRIALKVH